MSDEEIKAYNDRFLKYETKEFEVPDEEVKLWNDL